MTAVKEKRKGGRGFRIALLVIVLVNLVGIAVALCLLWRHLEIYEAQSPVAAMDAFFADVQAGDTQAIVARLDMRGNNTPEDYAAWLNRTFSGDVSAFRYAPLPDDGAGKRYAVYDGEKRRGEVRLYSPEGETGPWTVQPEVTYLPSYTVKAPAYVKMSLNGKPLPETCRQEETPVPLLDTQRDAARIPKTVTYIVSDLLEEPVFTASTPEGTACVVELDDKTREATVRVPVEGEELRACEEQLETVAKLYARYISQDAAFSELAAHLYKDTDFYDAVRTYDGQYYNKHNSYAFEKFAITEVERYSSDTFAGSVSFDYVIRRTHDTHTFPTKYRMAFQKIDGRYQLVELRIQ